MNERIRELAYKADFINKRHNGDFWRWGYIDPELNFQLEKFAQLIVGECLDIAKDVNKNPYLDEHHHARQIIKNITKHFGVQE